jgi:hypothetical protein
MSAKRGETKRSESYCATVDEGVPDNAEEAQANGWDESATAEAEGAVASAAPEVLPWGGGLAPAKMRADELRRRGEIRKAREEKIMSVRAEGSADSIFRFGGVPQWVVERMAGVVPRGGRLHKGKGVGSVLPPMPRMEMSTSRVVRIVVNMAASNGRANAARRQQKRP